MKKLSNLVEVITNTKGSRTRETALYSIKNT